MAGLFVLIYLAMLSAFVKTRSLAMALIFLSLVFALIIFWTHLTTDLPVNL